MAAHTGAAASLAPGMKPCFPSSTTALSTSSVLNLCTKYNSAERKAIRNNLAITISPKLKSALGRQWLLSGAAE